MSRSRRPSWRAIAGVSSLLLLLLWGVSKVNGEREPLEGAGATSPGSGAELSLDVSAELEAAIAREEPSTPVMPAATVRDLPPDGGLRRLRIVSSSGRLVQGAEVSVNVLTNDVLGHFWTPAESEVLSYLEDRTERIVEQRSFGVSNAGGEVQLLLGDRLQAPEGWVLWVTCAGYAPASLIGVGEDRDLPARIELQAEERSVARVVDEMGAAVEGASVTLVGLLPGQEGASDDLARLTRRALVRTGETGADGRVELSGAGGRSLVRARRGELLSQPVVRDAEGDVDLNLRGSFFLSARTVRVDGAALGEYAVVSVSSVNESGGEVLLGAVPCPPEGLSRQSFALPEAAEGPEPEGVVVARLQFGDSEVCTRSFPRPLPGELVEVEFKVRPCINHWFQVREWGDTDKGVTGARLGLEWQREGGPANWLVTRTARGGWAQVLGVPIGLPITPTVSGAGLEFLRFDPEVYAPEDHEEGTHFDVERAGIVRVRVTRDGEPVDGCSFQIWDNRRASAPLALTDVAGENGWHELDGIPYYLGSIAVISERGLLSAPVNLEHTDLDVVTEVELELAEMVPVRGRAVDARTGEAWPGARVWLQSVGSSGGFVNVSLEPTETDSEGRFEASYPKLPLAGVHVYSELPERGVGTVKATPSPDGSFDFGDVPLVGGFPLDVQVRSLDRDPDWTQFEVMAGFHLNLGIESDFDPEGWASLFSPLATRSVTIHTPRRLALAIQHSSAAEGAARFDVGLYTKDTLWVEAVDGSGDPVELGGALIMKGVLDGHQVRAVAQITKSGVRVAVPRPPMGRVLIGWRRPSGGGAMTYQEFQFGEKGDVEARLVLVEDPVKVRVVDRDGQPIPRVFVTVGLGWEGAQAEVGGRTDEEGLAELPIWEDFAWVHLSGEDETFAALDASAARPGPGEPVTWVFDPKYRLEVKCVDGESPVPYARMTLHSKGSDRVVGRLTGGSSGLAEQGGVGAGIYRVRAEAYGYFPTEVEVQVPGAIGLIDLPVAGSLEVQLVDEEGRALTGVAVELWSYELGEGYRDWLESGLLGGSLPVSGSDGRFVFDSVPVGAVSVRAGAGDWMECEVLPGERELVTLVLE